MSARYVTSVDVSQLRARLEQQPELFGQHIYRKEKYAHKDMDDIWVRYNHPDHIGPKFNDEHSSVWYPVIKHLPEIPGICHALMQLSGGERLGGVLITKLAPGGKIAPHIDGGWHAGYYSKFYVPIKNEPGSVFAWEDVAIDPTPGEVYEFRNDVPHWVNNDSSVDRIAMIVCIRKTSDALKEDPRQF